MCEAPASNVVVLGGVFWEVTGQEGGATVTGTSVHMRRDKRALAPSLSLLSTMWGHKEKGASLERAVAKKPPGWLPDLRLAASVTAKKQFINKQCFIEATQSLYSSRVRDPSSATLMLSSMSFSKVFMFFHFTSRYLISLEFISDKMWAGDLSVFTFPKENPPIPAPHTEYSALFHWSTRQPLSRFKFPGAVGLFVNPLDSTRLS